MKRILRTIVSIIFWSALVSVLWVAVLAIFDPPITWTMIGEWMQHGSLEREWVDRNQIARAMPLAVIAAEDQRFLDHHGFDLEAMQKAMEQNKKRKGKRIKGGSTISQQTAKNVFLWQGRNYLRKGIEVWFTGWIELLWSKERILTVYLNVAETGRARFGVGAVARACFNRTAGKLNVEQAALIAAVLPSPVKYSCERPSGYVRERQRWIIRQLGQLGDMLGAWGGVPAKGSKKRTKRKK